MLTPPHGPEHPISAAEVQDWIATATTKRLQLLLRATEPLPSVRAQVLLEMAALLKEAIEEVRVISAALQEERETLRRSASDPQEHSR